jgi:hypothetical protein
VGSLMHLFDDQPLAILNTIASGGPGGSPPATTHLSSRPVCARPELTRAFWPGGVRPPEQCSTLEPLAPEEGRAHPEGEPKEPSSEFCQVEKAAWRTAAPNGAARVGDQQAASQLTG